MSAKLFYMPSKLLEVVVFFTFSRFQVQTV